MSSPLNQLKQKHCANNDDGFVHDSLKTDTAFKVLYFVGNPHMYSYIINH